MYVCMFSVQIVMRLLAFFMVFMLMWSTFVFRYGLLGGMYVYVCMYVCMYECMYVID